MTIIGTVHSESFAPNNGLGKIFHRGANHAQRSLMNRCRECEQANIANRKKRLPSAINNQNLSIRTNTSAKQAK
jgi:hypothetical protein